MRPNGQNFKPQEEENFGLTKKRTFIKFADQLP